MCAWLEGCAFEMEDSEGIKVSNSTDLEKSPVEYQHPSVSCVRNHMQQLYFENLDRIHQDAEAERIQKAALAKLDRERREKLRKEKRGK